MSKNRVHDFIGKFHQYQFFTSTRTGNTDNYDYGAEIINCLFLEIIFQPLQLHLQLDISRSIHIISFYSSYGMKSTPNLVNVDFSR